MIKKPWYNPELTIRQMSEASGLSVPYISKFLKDYNLPYVHRRHKLEEYFDPQLTIRQMAEKAGISENAVRFAIRKAGDKVKYKRPLPDWYDSRLTASQMAFQAGLAKSSVYQFLKYNHLPYKRLINE